MKTYGATDVGMVRSNNQDAFKNTVLAENTVLSVVCDGMGGANAGNIASKMAIEIITDYIVNAYGPNLTSLSVENLLRTAISSANLEIFSTANKVEEYKGMGTTVVAALIHDGIACIAHVGDSRAYLVKSDGITQITRDHSVIQDLIESGQLTKEEARFHPKKNVITRAVGTLEDIIIDFDELKIGDGVVLLCTDGLTNMLSDEEILQIFFENELEKTADMLIKSANEKTSNDNVTVTLAAI